LSVSLSPPSTLLSELTFFCGVGVDTAYQQPVKYNFAVAREVLKQVYTAERLQPPASLGSVFGTYATLWARTRSIGYWREVVKSGEWARLGVYAVEAYGIFKVPFLLSSEAVWYSKFFLGGVFVSGWGDRRA
jgi:hypothetical protein